MALRDGWSTVDFLEQLRSGKEAAGWRMKIPGVSSLPHVEQMTKNTKILESFSEADHTNACDLNRDDFERIAALAGEGATAKEVEDLIEQFAQTKVLQKWLALRKKNGRALPNEQGEVMDMMMADPRGVSFHTPQTTKQKAMAEAMKNKMMRGRGGGSRRKGRKGGR